ncbi:MAG: hypothetical protein ACYDGY_09275, partial [Acidimicrobiales bacterium]
DKGPGTGGMGSYSLADGLLPFLDKATYDHACQIVQDTLEFLAGEGRQFSGCMNAGFFATAEGPKVIEFNSRFGDPEGLNIMTLFDGDWADVMEAMYHQSLNDALIPLARESSVVVYLVSPEYALGPGKQHRFEVDVDKASAMGVAVCFSAAVEEEPGHFITVGNSRAVAFAGRAPRLEAARTRVYAAVDLTVSGPLEKRSDIGEI